MPGDNVRRSAELNVFLDLVYNGEVGPSRYMLFDVDPDKVAF